MEYMLNPVGSYQVFRNCNKCGGRQTHINTYKFRVNANGNKIDVWLIYQCKKCRHTYNITIFERSNPAKIKDYAKFLSNDEELAKKYGVTKDIFVKSEIIEDSITLELTKINGNNPDEIKITNPYNLKLRLDKIVAEILDITRKNAKKIIEENEIKITVE